MSMEIRNQKLEAIDDYFDRINKKMENLMKDKTYDRYCPICSKPIREGDDVTVIDATNRILAHKVCLESLKKENKADNRKLLID